MKFRTRPDAASYLTERSGVRFTPEGLAALATKGTGPAFALVGGRALYKIETLDAWLADCLADASPSAKRGRRAPPADGHDGGDSSQRAA